MSSRITAKERWFSHSGDLGDIIYALPTIRAAGGGHLALFNAPGKTTHPMTQRRADALAPLLELQPYISSVKFYPLGHPDHDLNGFRDHWRPERNLADMHLATHGLSASERFREWIDVGSPNPVASTVFCRSERYHNPAFPWRRMVAQYGHVAVFLGSSQEHVAFTNNCGPVPHFETANLLEAARVLAGSKLCIANQSSLLAIAEGLKLRIIAEVCPEQANCIFARFDRIDAWDAIFELPLLT